MRQADGEKLFVISTEKEGNAQLAYTNNNYHDVLLEEIRNQNKTVLEYVSEMPKIVARLTDIEQDVVELKQDMKIVRAAITDISHQQQDHERRISQLEATH